MTTDPIAEARRVRADFSYYKALSDSTKLFDALTNLLSHVERLTAR